MLSSLYLIIILVFLFTFSAVFVVLYLTGLRRGAIKARLKDLEGSDQQSRHADEIKQSLLAKGASLLGVDTERSSNVAQRLAQAGYREPQAASNYYGAMLICAVTLGLVAYFLCERFAFSSTASFAIVLGSIVIGALLPSFWLARRVSARQEEIRRSVPHVLDLMVVCVEAGMSFGAAIQKIAADTASTYRALSEELKIANQEVLVGKSKAEAFRSLAGRTGVEDLRSLAITLVQAEKLGTSIANSLRVQADSMRYKRRQRAEELAGKASVKLVFPLVFLIFPQLLVVIVGPAIIHLFRNLTQVVN